MNQGKYRSYYFNIFNNVWLSKGILFGLILDIQKHRYYKIPIEILSIIISINELKINKIYNMYGEFITKVDEIIEFLLSKEIGYLSVIKKKVEIFNFEFHYPSKVTNCILELNELTNFKLILNQLNILNCMHLEIRLFNTNVFYELIELLEFSDFIKSVQIKIQDGKIEYEQYLHKLNNKGKLLLTIESYPQFENQNKTNNNIINISNHRLSKEFCGKVKKDLFVLNIFIYRIC